jgi:hypothetical protein
VTGATGCIRKDASYGVGRERGDASERMHHEERVRERSKRWERRDASVRTHCVEWAERRGRRDASLRMHRVEHKGVGPNCQEEGDASVRMHHLEWVGSVEKEGMHPKGRITRSRSESGLTGARGCIHKDASQGAGPKRREREDACSKTHVRRRGQSLVEEGMHTDVRISSSGEE